MRVIGDKPEGEVETVCKGCHWRLAYVPSDVYHAERDWDEGEPAYDYIICPKCRKKMLVNAPGSSGTRQSRDDYDY